METHTSKHRKAGVITLRIANMQMSLLLTLMQGGGALVLTYFGTHARSSIILMLHRKMSSLVGKRLRLRVRIVRRRQYKLENSGRKIVDLMAP